METRERICRFCFEKCNKNFKVIKRSTREILNILLVTTNLAISDDPVMCEKCSEILQKSFAFKNICLRIQDNTVAFGKDENQAHASCRFCMNLLKDNSFTILDIEDISEKTTLEKYFPELMDLSTTKKPKICEVCRESLVGLLSFITTSLIVEEKIKEYCEAKGVRNTDLIKLNDVINFTSEDASNENDNKLELFKMVFAKSENEKMKIEEGICILCLKKRENFKVIDENSKNILDIILPKIDFTGEQEIVMCENCEETLIKCFDFKAACLHNHNIMVPFFNNEEDVKLDQDVCAFCLNLVNNCSAISLDVEDGDIMLERMIEECLPELDLRIIKRPVMCASCHGSLEDCFHFVMNCLIVREQNKKYCKTPDVNSESQIELSSSLQFTTRDIKMEVDDNLANTIKVEDQFSVDSENLDDREISDGRNTVKLERTFLNDSEDAKKDIEIKCEGFMEIKDQEVNSEQKFMPKNVLDNTEESSIKIEETVCGEKETALKGENSVVGMEDQEFLLNEEIEIKTDEQDFNRHEDGIVLPQSEVARRLRRREKYSMLNLERDQSKSNIKHTLTKEQMSKIMYQCELCPFQTNRKKSRVNHNLILEGFKKHLLAHKDPAEVTIHNCDACSFQTKIKSNLKKHLLTHKDPSEATMYKCHLLKHKDPSEVTMHKCNSQAKTKKRDKNHLLKHKHPSEVTMYKCDFCSFQTKIKCNLKKHLLTHKDPSELTIYKCDFCSFQSKCKYYIKYHLLLHKDPSEVTMYKCDSCSFQTIFKRYLVKHSLKHKDPSEVTMYKCDFCSFQTKIKSCLKRHLLKHEDPSKVTMYKCDYCSFQTKTKKCLENHLLKHPSELTMYKCDSCSFQTRNKYYLTKHFKKHKDPSEVTIYKCDFCSFQTKSKYYIKYHLLTHKDPSEVTMYKCDSCSFQSIFKRDLGKHLLKHKDPSEITMYKCEFCSYETKIKWYLNRHWLKHKDPSEVTMYKCDFCSFQTKIKRNLNRHLLMHKDSSEVTMYECYICSYRTLRKYRLIEHLQRHTNPSGHLLKHKGPSEVTM